MEEWIVGIGANIRQQRKSLGLTQEQLAELAHVDTSYIGQIERGLREPSLKLLWRLSSSLQVSLSQLLVVSHPETSEKITEQVACLFRGLSAPKQEKLLQILEIALALHDEKDRIDTKG